LANRKEADGLEGLPGWREAPAAPVPLLLTWRSEGERRGEEKERR
jgi:hypothetical protein